MASMIGFFVGKAIAERQGLTPDAAMKYAAFGAVGGTSPTSILLVDIAAKREAEAQPQPQPGDATAGVAVPNVTSKELDAAQDAVRSANLLPVVKADASTPLVVARQVPDPNTPVSSGSEVQLFAAPKGTS